jgi:hypothetical protein
MNFLAGLGISIGGLLLGAAGVVAYDLVTGYSVADFLKDVATATFGSAKSRIEARLNRLIAKASKVRQAVDAKAAKIVSAAK